MKMVDVKQWVIHVWGRIMSTRKNNVSQGFSSASEVNSLLSYPTFRAGPEPASPAPVAITPISNLPKSSDDAIPSKRDLVIYRLRQEVAALRADHRRAEDKLTRCLELLINEIRFFELGLHYDQWETIGQVQARLSKLKAFVDMIRDPLHGNYEADEWWRIKKGKL